MKTLNSLLLTLAVAAAIPGTIIGVLALAVYSSGAQLHPKSLSEDWVSPLLISLYFLMFIVQWYVERRGWNNGICRANGIAWELAWVDSGMGRSYRAGDKRLMINNWFIGD